ncbi:MAG: RNA polymerase sigma factor [Solirubrobacteraceae bacterium]
MTGPIHEASATGFQSVDEVAELYAQQAVRVRRLVRGAVRAPEPVIEDACQFAWSRLIHHRASVQRGAAPSWLVRTAIREVFKLLRRGRREMSLDVLDGESGDGPVNATPVLEELVEQRARLESIRALPERQQRLVWLQGIGLTYTEMAGHTGDSRRTVERQLLRAKHRLERNAA